MTFFVYHNPSTKASAPSDLQSTSTSNALACIYLSVACLHLPFALLICTCTSMPLNVEKDLPSLPTYTETRRHMFSAHASTSGLLIATGSRPTLNLEKSLSPEELVFLHDRWNEATSAVCGTCTIRFIIDSLSCSSGTFVLSANQYDTVVCVPPL